MLVDKQDPLTLTGDLSFRALDYKRVGGCEQVCDLGAVELCQGRGLGPWTHRHWGLGLGVGLRPEEDALGSQIHNLKTQSTSCPEKSTLEI